MGDWDRKAWADRLCHPAPVGLLPDLLPAGPVELRRWTPTLADALCAAVEASRAELLPWMPWAQEEPTVDGLRAVLVEGSDAFDEDREWTYVLAHPSGSEVLGSTGLHRRGDPSSLEIGYWVRTDVTGRGYATAVARALTTVAFAALPWVAWTEIHVDAANAASARVPTRLGYRIDHEDDVPVTAPGQCGRVQVWVMERGRWENGPT